jgi:hypothetical protein
VDQAIIRSHSDHRRYRDGRLEEAEIKNAASKRTDSLPAYDSDIESELRRRSSPPSSNLLASTNLLFALINKTDRLHNNLNGHQRGNLTRVKTRIDFYQ